MFIEPRRRRGYRDEVPRSPALRRERAIAYYATAAVRIALAVALAYAAVEAYNLFRLYAPQLPPSFRFALPGLFGVGAAFSLRGGIASVRRAREMASVPNDLPDDGDDDGDRGSRHA